MQKANSFIKACQKRPLRHNQDIMPFHNLKNADKQEEALETIT